ncbi:MAG: beta-eliminating lyase-related protein [Pseudomonadota bacterium]
MFFSSDNAGPAAPEVMQALSRANEGYASPYGNDASMERVTELMRNVLEAPEAAVYLVATGTAANVLALSCFAPGWTRIYTHRTAHIEEDECGAPEFYTAGAKLHLLDGTDGKISPETLHQAIADTPQGFVHGQQRGAISITNLTECGTAYTPSDVAALGGVAQEFDLPLHMDGARFSNAVAGTNATAAQMTWQAGVDALSFGGTKNGLLGVEAVVFFDPKHAWEFELRRKRGAHLFSKHRYLSAQMEAYLTDDLWLRLARQSNAMAKRLSDGIVALGGTLTHPTDGNQVFASWAKAGHVAAQAKGAQYYLWPHSETMDGDDDTPISARLVCNWATTEDDVDQFLEAIKAG